MFLSTSHRCRPSSGTLKCKSKILSGTTIQNSINLCRIISNWGNFYQKTRRFWDSNRKWIRDRDNSRMCNRACRIFCTTPWFRKGFLNVLVYVPLPLIKMAKNAMMKTCMKSEVTHWITSKTWRRDRRRLATLRPLSPWTPSSIRVRRQYLLCTE